MYEYTCTSDQIPVKMLERKVKLSHYKPFVKISPFVFFILARTDRIIINDLCLMLIGLQIFNGPPNDESPQKVLFPEQLDGVQVVRIVPVEFQGDLAMKLEVLGCIEESE